MQQGVDFVLKNFERMYGGEIFVPIIPSILIRELATAIAPNIKQKVVGIRPGEKLHEIMCPLDDAHLTIKFNDHFVITPAIKIFDEEIDYTVNNLNEKGKFVDTPFEYESGSNSNFLTVNEINQYN